MSETAFSKYTLTISVGYILHARMKRKKKLLNREWSVLPFSQRISQIDKPGT